ncbi:MAG TPA: hypothetical protein VK810_02760 [Dongiaceae bacterium]|jgi:hypothetical protein|nr:hypothetical protein [Dongiaceae bacterium]
MKPDKLILEARARVIWGESPSSVRDFLTSNGIPKTEATAKIKEFYAERNKEIRKINLKKILIEFTLLGASAFMLYNSFYGSFAKVLGSVRPGGFSVGILAGCYGFWKLVSGITCLVRPQLENESIAEILD